MSDAQSPRLALCCVVDQHPRFYVELVLWTLCVTRNLSNKHFSAYVYLVGDIPDDLTAWVTSQGVRLRQTQSPVPLSPHCNKLAPFLDDWDMDADDSNYIAVTDVDLFFLADPTVYLNNLRFRAAPNNHANPPPHIWEAVLAASEIGRPYRPSLALFANAGMRETHINNISAGIVVAPRSRVAELAQHWKHWAEWTIVNRHLLGRWSVHVDQVAFALAMEAIGEDVEHLPPQTNAILHLLAHIETPIALHLTTGHIPQFPNRFGPDGTLCFDGLQSAAVQRLAGLNDLIREARGIIDRLPSTRDHYEMFLNPAWRR